MYEKVFNLTSNQENANLNHYGKSFYTQKKGKFLSQTMPNFGKPFSNVNSYSLLVGV